MRLDCLTVISSCDSCRCQTCMDAWAASSQPSVKQLRAATGSANPFTNLSGANFGVDFNPVADRLRVVSNTGQNLRINVDTGDTINDGTIAPASASVSASAYTNAFPGTTTTRLFNLNLATNSLDLQDPPNNGTLVRQR